MTNSPSDGLRPTRRGMLLQHVIVFAICILFPGAVTGMLPSTWLFFERSGDRVLCKTWTCVYFVVPYRIQQVTSVQSIGSRERSGGTRRQREYGRTTNKYVHVDGEGFLQILGSDGKTVEVSVSPASLEKSVAKCHRFLESTTERSATLFVIANWKFGGLMGGVLTSFTLLYVVGYSLEGLKRLTLVVKRSFAPG